MGFLLIMVINLDAALRYNYFALDNPLWLITFDDSIGVHQQQKHQLPTAGSQIFKCHSWLKHTCTSSWRIFHWGAESRLTSWGSCFWVGFQGALESWQQEGTGSLIMSGLKSHGARTSIIWTKTVSVRRPRALARGPTFTLLILSVTIVALTITWLLTSSVNHEHHLRSL